jgi:phage/plasmid-like protein (TIGR03299 family)
MGHQIEINNENGRAKIAYADRQVPWHRLGVPMKGLQGLEVMLQAAQADFDVVLARVAIVDDHGEILRNPDGTIVMVGDSRATVRVNPDGGFDALSTVGTRFVPQQNREVLQRALDVVGASSGDAVIDTCGVLREGREFFASIDLGSLIIDPTGVNDKIERFLLVRNGHDGTTPVTFANTSIRAVCKNTVLLGVRKSRASFIARHTRNADLAIEEARAVLNMSLNWAEAFKKTAEALLGVKMTPKRIDSVLQRAFPTDNSESTKQKNNRERTWQSIKEIYKNSNNSATFGDNGWSMLNSVGEYLDHYREGAEADLAIASMNVHSWVSKTKLLTEEFILTLV